jgi:type IV secretion system protein VirB9
MIKRLSVLALLSCAMPLGAALADAPADPLLPVDSRIRILTYDESDVYTLITQYGYQTNLVFGPDEEVETISMGDRSLWQIIPAGNRLFIRPMNEDLATNMTIITNRHSYQFDIKSLGNENKAGTALYVVKFRYPETRKKSSPRSIPVAAVSEPVIETPVVQTAPVMSQPMPAPAGPNYRYTFSGPDALAPLQVYDDGKSTYMKYRTMSDPLPSISAVSPAGKKTKATYRIVDDKIVIDQVAGEWAVTHGGGTITVYNEMLNPK